MQLIRIQIFQHRQHGGGFGAGDHDAVSHRHKHVKVVKASQVLELG